MDDILWIVFISVAALLVFFSAVGLAFFWVVSQAHKIMGEQKRDDA